MWLFLACMAVPTAAAPPPLASPAAPWTVLAVRDTSDAFVFCRAEIKDNDSPLTLAIALSAADEVNIGITVPNANYTLREGYDVKLAIDNTWSRAVTAETVLTDMLLVRLGKAPDFLAAVAKGKELRLQGDADATIFALPNSKKTMEQLRTCVKASAVPAPADDLQPVTLPEGLSALLQQAQLKVQPIAVPPVPGRMVDHAWRVTFDGAVVDGGFIERKATVASDVAAGLQTQATNQLALYAKQCRGKAQTQTDKVDSQNGIAWQTAVITCAAGDKTEVGAFLFYQTDTGIFATVIHRAPNSKNAVKARNAVADVVKRLAENP